MGLKADLKAISTEESGSKVKRPMKSILKNAGLESAGILAMPNWADALQRYLKEKYGV